LLFFRRRFLVLSRAAADVVENFAEIGMHHARLSANVSIVAQ
jgi:hypothetical protein